MKKTLPFLLLLALASLACSVSLNLTPEPDPGQVQPPTADNSGGGVVVEPTQSQPLVPTLVQANITCNEISFYLHPSLGNNYSCESIAEANDPDMPYFAINPLYTKITIHGYPIVGPFHDATISVYPYPRLQQLIPAAVDDYNYLQRLLTGGELPGETALPFLPYLGAAQIFHAQYSIVTFHNGSGIRYLTEFAQYTAPINNQDMFYTFQGTTSDGQYWITAILPANHPLLPADSNNPPNGLSWEDFSNSYQPYITDIKSQLDAQSWDSYTPQLGMLDDLISSLTIQP